VIRLAPFAPEDLEAIAAIEREAFAGQDPWSGGAFAAELRTPWAIWRVAWIGSAIGGYAGGWVLREDFHLLNLAVAPVWRRRGVGRRLVEGVMDGARERGCRRIFLEVRVANAAARRLYESAGFAFRHIRPGFYPDGDDAAVYERSLA
jgi:ribosomal-protein-alanine N-acetyltransferase